MKTENIYGSKFDKEVLKDLKEIDSKLKEEEEKEEPDREELLKLKRKMIMAAKGISYEIAMQRVLK